MSFLELVLVASIESKSAIMRHQLKTSGASFISTFDEWVKPSSFIPNLPNPISAVLAQTVSSPESTSATVEASVNESVDTDSQAAYPAPHWHTLSAVVELATEQTELITGLDVQFQPDQLAKHSEDWLHQAGTHLIDSAKSNPDPATQISSSDAANPSHLTKPDLSNDEQAATDTKPAPAFPLVQRLGLIERFKSQPTNAQRDPRDPQRDVERDMQIVVKALAAPETAVPLAIDASKQSQHTSCAHNSAVPQDAHLFQVWVGEQAALHLLNSEQAESIAQKLRSALTQNPKLEPERFQLRLFDNQPAIYIQDALNGEPLVVITDELAKAFSNDNTLLAIDWINHLRMAFDGTPMDVAQVQAEMHDLQETPKQIEGNASWYGPWFHGRLTATGEIFDKGELTAAHPSLPFDTYLKVTNLENSRSVIVRINDRGPYIEGRNLDLSHRAAQCLGSEESGVIPFKAVVMDSPVNIAAAE